jgi:hypothetical protein
MYKKFTIFKLMLLAFSFILYFSNPSAGYGAVPSASCPDDLLVLLRMDETSGPTYADYYGVNNAIATNAPTATTGIINGGQLFSEENYVNIPDNRNDFEWEAGCSFSLEFWIKSSNHDVPQVGISRQIKGGPLGVITWWLGINEYGGAVMEITDNNGNNYAVYNKDFSMSYTDNQWHHIVGVKDGTTDYMAIYVDGELIEGKTAVFDGDFIAPVPTDVSIGYMLRADGASFEYHVNGSLDEVAIYTRALSPQDISTFYNEGNPEKHCNSAPAVTSTANTVATEDVPYSYNFVVNDFDASDALTLSVVSKPSWLNFAWEAGQKTAVLSGTPTNENTGSNNVTLRVNDGFASTDQSFTINVAKVNDVPVIIAQNVLNINEDTEITLSKSDLTITDVDNPSSDLTLQVLAGSNYTFNGNSVTPNANFNGSLSVNIVVKDLIGQSQVYPVLINVLPVNDLPFFTSTPQLNAEAGNVYQYEILFTDIDGDVLTITAPSKPGWLNFTTGLNNAILNGTPTLENIGPYPVVLTINDGHNDVSQEFTLTVIPPSAIDGIDNSIINFVFPNPTSDNVFFNFANSGETIIEIYDVAGNLQKRVQSENNNVVGVNMADLPKGIYLYKALHHNKICFGKIARN